MGDEKIIVEATLKLDTTGAKADALSYAQTVSKEIKSQSKKELSDIAMSVRVDPSITNLKALKSQLTKSIQDFTVPVNLDSGMMEQIKSFSSGAMDLDGMKSLMKSLDGIEGISTAAGASTAGLTKVLTGMTQGLSGLLKLLGPIGLAVLVLVKALKGTDTMNAIMEQFNGLMNSIQEIMAPLLAVIGDIVIVLLQMVESILPILQPAIDMLTFQLSLLAQVLDAIVPLIEMVGKAFEFLWDIIKNFISMITFGLVNLGSVRGSTTGLKTGDTKTSLDTWETLGEQKPTAGEKLIADTVAEGTKATGGFLTNLLSGITSFLEPVFQVWANIMQSIWDVIMKIVAPIADAIVAVLNIVASALNGIASVFNGVVGIIKSILELIQSAFSFLAGIVNTIKNGINTFIIGPINWVLGKIKGINILGVKPFDFIKLIQTFKDGGTLGAQVWGMNEKGNPEFMFNAGGHDTVINSKILEDAMYNAMVRATATGSKELQVSVKGSSNLGARELANWVLPYLKFNLGGSR